MLGVVTLGSPSARTGDTCLIYLKPRRPPQTATTELDFLVQWMYQHHSSWLCQKPLLFNSSFIHFSHIICGQVLSRVQLNILHIYPFLISAVSTFVQMISISQEITALWGKQASRLSLYSVPIAASTFQWLPERPSPPTNLVFPSPPHPPDQEIEWPLHWPPPSRVGRLHPSC